MWKVENIITKIGFIYNLLNSILKIYEQTLYLEHK